MFFEGIVESAEGFDEEVIYRATHLAVQRRLRAWVHNDLYRAIQAINLSHHVTGETVYLVPEDLLSVADSTVLENIRSMVELIFVGITTRQFVEIVGDFISEGIFACEDINSVLEQNGQMIHFQIDKRMSVLRAELLPAADVKEATNRVPNIKMLFERMNDDFARTDYGAVLHTSVTIFETLMKDKLQRAKNKGTLDKMLRPYCEAIGLPGEIQNYLKNQYIERNKRPLAGHGSIEDANLSKQDAIIIIEMAKMIVRIHMQLPIPKTAVNA